MMESEGFDQLGRKARPGRSRYLYLFDLGHGSDTPGKRSPLCTTGERLYEWRFVRQVYQWLIPLLEQKEISFHLINPELHDLPLATRCFRANHQASLSLSRKPLFISLHGNAASDFYIDPQCTIRYQSKVHPRGIRLFTREDSWHEATGIEAFTSPGETLSDRCCQIFLETAREELPGWKIRTDLSDGDWDKEEDFFVLRHTRMPAMLLELGFYTHPVDCAFMSSPKGQQQFASVISQTIGRIESEKALG